MPSRERIAQEANTIGALVKQANGDKGVAQLLVIQQYGPAVLDLAGKLSSYMDMAVEMLPMLIEQADAALPVIKRGQEFMAENGYEPAVRAYLEANEAPEAAYLQMVGKIGAALLEKPESETEIHEQLAEIVAEYGKTPAATEEELPTEDFFNSIFAQMLG